MGDSLRRGKAAGQKAILSGRAHHRGCNILFVAALAGIAVINMLLHDHPRRNDLQLIDDFFPNLRQFSAALGTDQVLLFQPVLNLFYRDILWDFVQRVFMSLVALMGSYNGHSFFVIRFCKHFRFVKQKTQLLTERILALFGRRAKALMPCKAQRFHKHLHMAFQRRNTLALSLKLFIFRLGDRDRFWAVCLKIVDIFHVIIIPYESRKVQKNTFPSQIISSPPICLCAFGWSMFNPSMSQRYCCIVSALASLSFRGHWKLPDSSRL